MKNFLLVAILGFAAWSYYTNNLDAGTGVIIHPHATEKDAMEGAVGTYQQDFRCDGRLHCSQMTSRAEAEFFTKNCPNTKMDGDRDGIPCENDHRF
ncbi:cold-shock protein [Alcanivorax sp. MD8A]|nr:cold-shock protein [Alcanivorax sp. MD8A]